MDTAFDFIPVSLDEAKKALDEGNLAFQPPVKKAQGWQRGPQRIEDKQLLPQTAQWLQSLPEQARPTKCAEHYPRIANRLCKLWPSPLFLKDYLQDLVLDKRGGRQGFPHGITHELEALRRHYELLHPSRESCVWMSGDAVRR